MGYDYAYFVAANDGDAGATAERTGGPLGWPTEVGVRKLGWFRREAIIEEPGPVFEGFGISGYDPVMLQALAGLLKPRASNDRRWGLDVTSASAADDFCGVQTLPTSFRDLLDETSTEILRTAMRPWSQTEELRLQMQGSATEDHLEFVLRLQTLARTARQANQGLYFYWRE